MSGHEYEGALRLRAVEPEDLEFLYRIENDEELWEVGITNVPFSKFTLTNYILNNANDIYADRQVRFVMENENGNAVGILDITNFDPKHLRAEIGIVVIEPERNKGYGRLAMEHAVGYCREVLHLHQLFAVIDKDNISSLHLFKSVGFKEGGILKQWLFCNKIFHDALLMQLFL